MNSPVFSEVPYNIWLDDGVDATSTDSEGVLMLQLADSGPEMEVCHEDFPLTDAMLVCQMLGYRLEIC